MFFLPHRNPAENVVDNVQLTVKKKRKKRFSESVDEEVSVKTERISQNGAREVTAQLESELGPASSAERPRKRTKENRDVQHRILYVSKKVECYELFKTSGSF